MKPYSGLVAGAVTSVLALPPAYSADMRQIVDLDIRPEGTGLQVQFAIAGTDNGVPQVFTISRDNQTITDILNTQLDIGDSQTFTQRNPMPGIEAIEIMQLDPESVRIIATGQGTAPTGEMLSRDQSSFVFNFTPQSEAIAENENNLIAQVEAPAENTAEPTSNPEASTTEPDILFPDPQIPREGKPSPTTAESLLRPSAPLPPFLPRASAPPVGDIAISTVDTSFPNYVDLGTASVVPRLVLKEAPTQDVLTLLARSAELNLVFADDITDKNISLDLENEPVQDVFNYVLMLSELDATMRGRTIFVGTELPRAISPKVTRTFRLNQADVLEAQTYLESAGTDEDGLLPDIQILTDERLNAITVTGEPKVIEIASNFLTQLDARKRQVAVNVKILDVTLSGNRSISSDIKLLLEDRVGISAGDGIILSPNDLSRTSTIFGDFNDGAITVEQGTQTVSLGEQLDAFDTSNPDETVFIGNIEQAVAVAASIDNNFTASAFNFADPNQLVAVIQEVSQTSSTVNGQTIVNSQVTARLEGLGNINTGTSPLRGTNFVGQLVAGLLRNTTTKIVADPTLIIQEDEIANIDLTEDIVVGTRQIEITNNDGDVIGAGEEPVIDEVGLQVEVEVTGIDDNGFISMNIEPSISSIAGSEIVDDEPVTLKRESKLTSGLVRLRDDQTLILAGVIDERDIVETSKVPLLGDIPLIGSLFRSSSRLNSRRELLFIITPQIIDDSQNATWGYGYVPSETARDLLGNENFPTDDD
ncbi:secretin N-terminal domain-containing protein [[Leptolyngbya] sp. PCC 7376]|uniref:secretin N-terminal domain-containing protein n=1 Tax=[Leptolyngbya] sp. PCC 7376 TaxID=111781 RepID=UPI00030B65B0|nr:secretin N-terminal domain-containing protein [[Leptolyngbya] sp. PCC 7376]